MICIIIIDSDLIIMHIAFINTIQYSLRWKNIFQLSSISFQLSKFGYRLQSIHAYINISLPTRSQSQI